MIWRVKKNSSDKRKKTKKRGSSDAQKGMGKRVQQTSVSSSPRRKDAGPPIKLNTIQKKQTSSGMSPASVVKGMTKKK